MNVGWVGLGKLGLPCAVALNCAGHDVMGFDVDEMPAKYLANREVPYREAGLPDLLKMHTVTTGTIDEVVDHADIVFVAVQTPHDPAYDGTTPAPERTKDFEYGYLVSAVRQIALAAERHGKRITVAIVSTVLPGTFNRHLRCYAGPYVALLYNPFFIAMGTTVKDFTEPEFVLIGTDQHQTADASLLADLYSSVHDRPIRFVSIESAELTKVAYNVYLSAKIAFANYVGEICHKSGADADEVTESLALATDRILSPRYMSAGMGDGGACHPRDLIALSELAARLDLSFDLAGAVMDAREAHSDWLAELATDWANLTGRDIVILGQAYKPESDLTFGSPARLLANQLTARGFPSWTWDPHVHDDNAPIQDAAVFVVATRHPEFPELAVPAGSVIIDPFGYIPDRPGVTVVWVGRKG